MTARTRNRIVGAILAGFLAWVIIGWATAHHSAGPAAAPKVGDHCTRHGQTFTYNDGGPGFVEQTSFGLICQ